MRLLVLSRLAALGLCVLGLGLGHSGPVLAQSQSLSSNLLDYWLQRQADQRPMPVDWAYAYIERQTDEPSFRQRRLDAELEGLALALRLSPSASMAVNVQDWRQALDTVSAQRSPGRVDVAWLAANPRQVPTLAEIQTIGFCTRPVWVEVWSAEGVTRVVWHSGMQSDDLLDAMPEPAIDLSESAALISPLGDIHRFGIAAWNHTTMPVAPGSRLWLDLPDNLAPGQATVTRWLNTAMPEALAAQPPGDECTTLWHRDAATTDSPE